MHLIKSTYQHIDSYKQLSLADMLPNTFKYEAFAVQIVFRDQTCIIYVKEEGKPQVYQGKYNNDTIPQNYKILFDAKQLFQTIADDKSIVLIEDPLRFDINWRSGKNIKKISLPLSQKQQSNQERALRELHEARQSQEKIRQQLARVNNRLIEKQQQIFLLRNELAMQRQTIVALRKGADVLIEMESKLRAQLRSKDETINVLLSQAQKYQHGMRKSSNSEEDEIMRMLIQQSVLFQNQCEEKELLGTHLMFKPLEGSVNSVFYQFNDRILKRNNNGLNGNGKFIASADPIPKTGLLSYKFLVKYASDSPNFKIGLYWNQNPSLLQYIYNNDTASISYYCNKLITPEITNKGNRIPAFAVGVGKSITMTVDWSKRQLRWYLQGQFKVRVPLGMDLLDEGKKVYCFVQLWNNGDSLMIL